MYSVLLFILLIAAAVAVFMNSPKFGRSPRGERLERIKKSPHYRNGQFHNIHATRQITSGKSRAGTMLEFLFGKKERNRPGHPLPVIKTDLKNLDKNENLLIWFGHSSYLIQAEGKRILVDPVFMSASPVGFFNKPFKGTAVYNPEDIPDIDYLIITHDHWDHLDYGTVKQLKGRTGKVICPLGVGEHLEYWGFKKEQLVELDWNEEAPLGEEFRIYCLPARHFSGRNFISNRTLWASFLLQTPARKIFIAGDGGYDTHFMEIARRFPEIDLAILENGQYNTDWKYIHLMPQMLPRVIRELNPRKVLTVHHAKYALARHPWDEPLNNACRIARNDTVNLIMPQIGETVSLDTERYEINKWW